MATAERLISKNLSKHRKSPIIWAVLNKQWGGNGGFAAVRETIVSPCWDIENHEKTRKNDDLSRCLALIR
ncbi:MAG: hypothetical protein EXS05_22880 [Planctomycetaceae bacterium]|nr:hypothetical protein [Planctomycetaceae bacterium]